MEISAPNNDPDTVPAMYGTINHRSKLLATNTPIVRNHNPLLKDEQMAWDHRLSLFLDREVIVKATF